MYRKTNPPTTSIRLETIGRVATQKNRTQFTRARKTNPVRRTRCHLESQQPQAKDTNLDGKIQACLDTVDSRALRQFLASVVQQPDVREVLASPLGHCSLYQGSRFDAMRPVALAIRQQCPFGEFGRDVLYVAALLHGIQHGLTSCVLGNADLNDVMFTIARGPLHRLDELDSSSACLLRLCMGWGNPDEASELAEQLQQMMLRASRSMDCVNALTEWV